MTDSNTEDAKIRATVEGCYPDYTVDSYRILHRVEEETTIAFILQDVRLTGRPKPSACGRYDGQPVPRLLAPSWLPHAGFAIRIERQMELAL